MINNKSIQKSIELKDVYEILANIDNTLKELLKWTRFSGIKEVKPMLESKLDTDTKKITYALSDGSKGTREISKMVGSLSHTTIANYWQEWEKAGLGDSAITMGGGTRFKRSFDLEDFGIKVPEIPKQEPQQTQEVKIEEQLKQEAQNDGN